MIKATYTDKKRIVRILAASSWRAFLKRGKNFVALIYKIEFYGGTASPHIFTLWRR